MRIWPGWTLVLRGFITDASMQSMKALSQLWQPVRRQPVTLAALSAIVVLSWWYLVNMAQGMAAMDMPTTFHPWSGQDFLLMLLMWIIMMVGMMIPSALPMILLYQQVTRHNRLRHVGLGVTLFVLGYLLVWSLFSLLATVLQWQLERLALLSPMLASNSLPFSATVLILIGLYQWTPWKDTCLRWCRGPMLFITRHWQPGLSGALRMGLRHGAFCTGCCWMLMALLFVGGIMDLMVIAAVAILVLLEKLLPGGRFFARGVGILAILTGLLLLNPY